MFWLMCLCVVGNCVATYVTSSFLYPHFQSVGYSTDEAAVYQSTFMLALAFVKLGAGFLHDRFGVKPVMIGCMIAGIIGQLTLGLTSNATLSMVAVVLFSGSLSMTTIMIPLISAPLFGHKACLQLNGIFLGLSSLSAIFANPISSMCFDRYGVYGPVFRIMPIVNTVILITYLVMFASVKKKTRISS
jgi:MFS family permease